MWKPIALILLIILIGTLGFHFLENLTFLDSLYMTIITIFTVGFREVKEPLSVPGQIFTIFLILSGVSTAVFAFTKIAEAVYEGGIFKFIRRKKMEKRINGLKDHYIICGYGRIGKTVVERLQEETNPFIVVDNKPERLEELKKDEKTLVFVGDATEEEVLTRVGVKKAYALAALLPTDADNLYLVFTAKLLNPSLFIFSKALDEDAERKLLQIGANKIVSPYKLSGYRIAQGLIRPTLVDFMDLIIRRKEISLYMEEFVLTKGSSLVDLTLKESDIRSKANVIVVAIKKPGKDIVFNPSPDSRLETGDTILVLGDKKTITAFDDRFIA